MTLLEAWKDSLLVCRLQSIKLMLLVTLNAMKEGLKVLRVPWFLITLSSALIIAYFLKSPLFSYFLYHGVTAMVLLAARPSISKKDIRYFFTYAVYYCLYMAQLLILLFIGVFLAGMGFGLLHNIMGYGPQQLCGDDPECIVSGWFFLITFLGTQYMGLLIYPLFFYLDRIGNVFKCLFRGLYLMVYNLPLILIYGVIIFVVYYVYWAVFAVVISVLFGMPFTIQTIWIMGFKGAIAQYGLLGIPPYFFAICLMYNIYTKRVHDQYSLYQ